MRRCHCETTLRDCGSGARLALSDSEAHHLRDVLRAAVGTQVELFDGRGWSAPAGVIRLARSTVELELLAAPQWSAPPRPAVWLGVAPPKADRLRWLVEKATELGVDRLSLLTTDRTVVDPGQGKLQKLQIAALEACKQCGRNAVPRIDPPCRWEAAVDRWWAPQAECSEYGPESRSQGAPASRSGARPTSRVSGASEADDRQASVDQPPSIGERPLVLLADRSGVPLPDLLGDADLPGEIGLTGDRPVGVLIGPEGGWSPAELERAIDRGIRFTRLGPHLLRTETAAIAAVACIRALCEGAS